MTSILRSALFAATGLVLGPGPARPAQAPDPVPDAVLVRSISSRWIHQDERDRDPDPPFLDEVVELRETYRSPDGMHRSVEVEFGSLEASVILDGDGRVGSLSIRPPPLSYPGRTWPGLMERNRLRRLRSDRGLLVLPSGPFRDLWIPLPRPDLGVGDRWVDTLTFVDSPGEGLEESYREIRRITVVGDTVWSGTPAYWLRTEGRVEYSIHDGAFHGPLRVAIDRTVEGRSAGRVAVDARSGLRVAGADTLHMTGEAVLHDPVAGALQSGAEVHRVRRWRHFDAEAYAAFRDSSREASRNGGGMVITPRDSIERRIAAGDMLLADSLVELWKATSDADSARVLRAALRWLPGSGSWTRQRFDSLTWAVQLERGDTADLVARARDRLDRELVVSEARLLLPFLDDSQRLWRIGRPVGNDYLDLARSLLVSSPLVRADSSSWRCRPPACSFWLDQYRTASDARLRDAALVGLFGRDPAEWYPEVRARSAAGSAVVEPAMRLARGQAWEDRPEMPAADASWRDWAAWWGPLGNALAGPEHAGALRVYEAVTGRDPLRPWLERWPPANDSARFVLGRILRGTGHLPELSADEIRALLLAGEDPPIGRPGGLFGLVEAGTAVNDDEAAEFLVPLIRARIEGGGYPWPRLRPREGRPPRQTSGGEEDPEPTLASFVVETGLPDAVLVGLPAGAEPISQAERRLREFRAGAHVHTFERPLRWGPFVLLESRATLYLPQGPDRLPAVYASGGRVLLVETPEGWKVVATDGWIT